MDLNYYKKYLQEEENSYNDILFLLIHVMCLISHIIRFKDCNSLKEKAFCVFLISLSIFWSFVFIYDMKYGKWKNADTDNLEFEPLGELIYYTYITSWKVHFSKSSLYIYRLLNNFAHWNWRKKSTTLLNAKLQFFDLLLQNSNQNDCQCVSKIQIEKFNKS